MRFFVQLLPVLFLFISTPPAAARNSHRSLATFNSISRPAARNHRRVASAIGNTTAPRSDPDELVKRDGSKYVFMHHIVGNTYSYTQADWSDDIQQIQAKGVDALALNIGSDGWQRTQVASAYAAAAALGSGFKLFISFDFTEMACDIGDVVSRVNQWSGHPNQFLVNGKNMISTYSGDCFGNSGWESIKAQTNGYLMPFIWGLEGQFGSWPCLDSWYCWGCAWPQGDFTTNTDADNYYLGQLGSRYATTISGWIYTHYSYKNFLLNSDGWLLNTRWEQLVAMRSQITFVEMVTWNDYGESDYYGPIKGDQPAGTTWATNFPHTAWFDMSQYYITAFKTGSYPAITQDVIYFWARPHPAAAGANNDPLGKPTGWDWTEDSLWVAVFATSASTVTLKSGSNSNSFQVDAGVSKLKLPLSPGSITVMMTKPNGQVVINKTPTDFAFVANPDLYNYNAYVGSASSGSSSPPPAATATSSGTATSSATATSSTSATAPAASGSGSWTSLGCYVDPTPSRVLTGSSSSSASQTVAGCLASCAAQGFSYAGTEWAQECWCGSSISQGSATAPAGDCSTPCTGKASDICGGGNRLSLYTTKPPTSISTVSTGGWSSVGCVAEGSQGSRRSLTGPSFVQSNMTPDVCQSLCQGYTYAGVEYSSECYCGNSLTNNGATGAVIDPSSCSSSCAGDSSQTCGGSWTLSLYSTGSTQTPPPTSGTSGWTSAGCYTDSSSRLLRSSFTDQSGMTTEQCIGICSAGGYTIAATEYSTQCLCGSHLYKKNGAGVPAPSGDCDMNCSGNSSEKCGGSYRANVYTAPNTPALTRRHASWRR